MSKNILWVVLDSIRADRTPFGAENRQTMPTLSSLPEAVGTTCISHGIWSQPSLASMLTGTWPSRHGVGLHNEVLPQEITTVPERLSAAGYRTVGLSTNPYFSPETGLGRGFDECEFFGVRDLFREAGLSGALSFARHWRHYSGGLTLEKRKHSPDFLFNQVVKDELSELAAADQPFAMVAHYHGVHHPYYPAPAYIQDSQASNQAAELAYGATEDPYETIANGDLTDAEWEAIRQTYDGLIRQIDGLMGRLLDHVEQLGLTDDTIIVITSDHGDLLGELELVSHKLVVHDALIAVPLVVRGSDRLSDIDGELVQHIDIMQTILAEVGASTEGMEGIELPEEHREFAVAQRGGETAERTLREVTEINPAFETSRIQDGLLTAVRTEDWKFIQGESDEVLYRLPDERTDRSQSEPARHQELAETAAAWLEAHGEPVSNTERTEFGEEIKQQLADLGYRAE